MEKIDKVTKSKQIFRLVGVFFGGVLLDVSFEASYGVHLWQFEEDFLLIRGD